MANPYLEVQTAESKSKVRLDGQPVTIGRHPENRLRIKDERASRFHCVIEPVDGGYQVRDLDSRNGTKLNDHRISVATLRTGDVVRIGQTTFRFIDPDAVVAEPVEVAPASAEEESVRRAPELISKRSSAHDPFASAEPDYNALLDDLSSASETFDDHEQVLLEIADAQPDRPFEVADISLVDSKGVTIHAAEQTGLKRSKDDHASREGLRVVKLILLATYRTRATDIHIEPKNDFYLVRLRVDGTMVEVVRLNKDVAARVVGVIKVLSNIDIAQRNIVQEGHFSSTAPGRRVDYRVSFTPSMYGQKLVIRVLDLENAPRFMHELEMPGWMYNQVKKVSRQDAGMVLVCGPTGSGKTTTLYSVLRDIDTRQRNVITIEDPVEYQIDGVTQIPIDEHRGNTFNTLLRSVLRQDPDVILLGEIRDRETAATAMQAAMTGHLVLSTVHARDTIGTIFRLLDLGVEPYLVASSLNLVLAQRLIRKLCPYCKADRKPTPNQTLAMGRFVEGLNRIFFPVGCTKCLGTGYSGRRAIFELLTVTDDLRDVVLKTPTIHDLREAIRMTMFTSLQQSGFHLVAEGITSFDEVERVASGE